MKEFDPKTAKETPDKILNPADFAAEYTSPDAHFEEVKILLAELTEWKLAAWKMGLYMAGTDVSTPAKWTTAQLSAYERLKVQPFTNAR